jgi:hypothetical protein
MSQPFSVLGSVELKEVAGPVWAYVDVLDRKARGSWNYGKGSLASSGSVDISYVCGAEKLCAVNRHGRRESKAST